MPQGTGTYGSKVGRPPKRSNPPTPPVNLKQPRQGTRGPTNPNEMSRTLRARKAVNDKGNSRNPKPVCTLGGPPK